MRRYPSLSDGPDAALARDPLAEAIEHHIERAAFGRINGLRVDRLGDGIVLNGRCRTYHSKQIAQQAALDLADASVPLINEIVVC